MKEPAAVQSLLIEEMQIIYQQPFKFTEGLYFFKAVRGRVFLCYKIFSASC